MSEAEALRARVKELKGKVKALKLEVKSLQSDLAAALADAQRLREAMELASIKIEDKLAARVN